jgi:hypothetical protein
MSVSQSDLDSFHQFASQALTERGPVVSLEGLFDEWRARRANAETIASNHGEVDDEGAARVRELADLRGKVQEAKAASRRGESAELDIDQVVREVTKELAAEGIRE